MTHAKTYEIQVVHPDGTSKTHQMTAEDILDWSDNFLAYATESMRCMRNANWSAGAMMVGAAFELVLFVVSGHVWIALAVLTMATLGLLDRRKAIRHLEDSLNAILTAESLSRAVGDIRNHEKEQAA